MKLLTAQKLDREMNDLIMKRMRNEFELEYLYGAPEDRRRSMLEEAVVLLATNFRRDIREDEMPSLKRTRLIQTTLAGADMIPYDKVKPEITICSNGGAYSEPIAEHAIGMMIALARSFFPLHQGLSQGVFDQKTRHKMLGGSTLGIVGYGGIGKKTAAIARAFGMRIIAINSTGRTDGEVSFIGTLDDLDRLLRESDFLLLTIGLNKKTKGMIGSRELGLMRPDAVLINVSRGDLIDERSLYEHLKTNPRFKAGIDTWWVEPFNHPKFEVHYPFFQLENVLGSPHNSYLTDGIRLQALDRALDNILRFAHGEPLRNVQRREDYI